MPAHTSPPPAQRGESEFWAELLRIDDDKLHFWYGINLGSGQGVDIVVADQVTGCYCLEVKATPLDFVKQLDLQSLTRKDGALCPSPFRLASYSVRYLGAYLEKTWDAHPDMVAVAVFPLITREEWLERFEDDAVYDLADKCLLKDDLVDIEAFRARLTHIAASPIGNRSRKIESCDVAPEAVETLDQLLKLCRGQSVGLTSFEGIDKDAAALALLDEVIGVVKGPGAAYHSPGGTSLALWRAALSDPNERLRVSVVGEFKSGKSSLINAVLGTQVCFVDEFEATTINALYTDGPAAGVSVINEHNDVEAWTVDEFLERCASKELEGIRRITVTVPTGLPFDLVDSPGLGSNSEGLKEEAELEIRKADLLLWTVDCNDAGSAREAAFIGRAREVGLPILVLLTKSDVLADDEVGALSEYLAEGLGVPAENILPISSHTHSTGGNGGVNDLIERLKSAAVRKVDTQAEAHTAKLRDALDGAGATLRFLVEINAPHSRFLSIERGYLETSALGVGVAAKAEWLRVLREECSLVATNIASKSIDDPEVVELMVRKALPDAVNRATAKFLQSLKRLVRDEWRGALEERSREFERQLTELAISRPEAKADLEFLRGQSDAFRLRAEILGTELEPATLDNRLLIVGLGAAASVITVSILPIALAGVVAAVAIRERKAKGQPAPNVDHLISSQIEGAIISSFSSVESAFERAIERMVNEVAERSLITLLKRRGGPDLPTILAIERKASDLMDDIAAFQKC